MNHLQQKSTRSNENDFIFVKLNAQNTSNVVDSVMIVFLYFLTLSMKESTIKPQILQNKTSNFHKRGNYIHDLPSYFTPFVANYRYSG